MTCAAAIIFFLLFTIWLDNAKIDKLENQIELILKATEIQNQNSKLPQVIVATKKQN